MNERWSCSTYCPFAKEPIQYTCPSRRHRIGQTVVYSNKILSYAPREASGQRAVFAGSWQGLLPEPTSREWRPNPDFAASNRARYLRLGCWTGHRTTRFAISTSGLIPQ